MRVAWLQDYSPFTQVGGAELNDKGMILHGIKEKGINVDIVTPQIFPRYDLSVFDLVIVSNCVTFPREHLNKMADVSRYVIFTHDYFFCRWRSFFQGQEKCKKCKFLNWWKNFYSHSLKNIFLSPYHYAMHRTVFSEDELNPHIEVPSAVNIDDFQPNPNALIEPNSVISVGGLWPFRGKEEILKYAETHKDMKFTFVGGNPDNPPMPSNARFLGQIANEKLFDLYRSHEYSIHLPRNEPCSRAIIEFLLCNPKGKVIANENLGFLSYKEIYSNKKIDRKKVKEFVKYAPTRFWNAIEEEI